MMEDFSRESLYQYLNYVKLAIQVQNEQLDLKNLDGEERERFTINRGVAMLAQEIITRYGLAPAPEDN